MKYAHPFAIVLFGTQVLTGACERRPKTPIERGAGIFIRSCAGCHGADGRGIARPGLTTAPRNLTDATWQASMTDDEIRTRVRVGKGQMPSFGALLDGQSLDEVVLYIRSLRAP